MEFKDYYKILGLTKTATLDEIKKAYHKLAIKYHPDKNKGNKELENKFKEANEAYEVLKDPDKRKKYDNLGSSYNRYQQTGGNAQDFDWADWISSRQSGRKKKGGAFSNMSDFAETGGSVSDFFEKIFGDSFSSRGSTRQQQFRGGDATVNVELTLEEAFHGTSRLIQIADKKIEVKIKPGIADGQSLKIAGKGSPGQNNGPAGDLFIKIKVLPHSKVERKGDDLYIDVPVDLYKAILGGTAKLKSFSGVITIQIPPETQPGKILRIPEHGMPKHDNPSVRGDLYVTLQIKLPKILTDEEKELFTKLKELRK